MLTPSKSIATAASKPTPAASKPTTESKPAAATPKPASAAPKTEAKTTPPKSSAPATTGSPVKSAPAVAAKIASSIHKDSFTANNPVAFRATGNVVAMKAGGTTDIQQVGTTGTTATIDDVVDALQDGKTDDATRTMIAGFFEGKGMADSNAAMQRIRDEGLLNA